QRAYRAEFEGRLQRLLYPQASGPAQPWDPRRRARMPSLGGEAVRQRAQDPILLRCHTILAVLINHPELIASRLEVLAHLTLPVRQLDKLRQCIIDLAAHHPDLDAETLKNHLCTRGFEDALPEVLRRAAAVNLFTLASAPSDKAGDGLDDALFQA